MTRRTPRRRRRSAFTLIEVMISLGVMMVGGMAILALQQHTIRSNAHARELTVAMQIAQLWVERLKQDAATWNQAGLAGGTPSVAQVLSQTVYLRNIATPPAFQTLPAAPAGSLASNAFNRYGDDVTAAPGVAGDFHYCASARLGWVYFGRAMRADVRVWWAREGRLITNDFPTCQDNDTALSPGGAMIDNYHVVYLPTVIRMVTVTR